ncbi:hypothetical protein [Mediterraneibacter gnavus]|uniref:hypothetical protein n=1 Tax=Mediterraneibacter gnavus TaxID=33038 RepID=UPI00356221DB
MAEMKNICGKIPIELHEKVRAEIELNESSTQLFIQQVIEEHFSRLEGKGELSMEKRTLAVQVSEELFQKVKWAVAKEGMKQKDFIIRIIEKAIEDIEAKWQEIENPNVEELPESEETETAEAEGYESEEGIGEEEEMTEPEEEIGEEEMTEPEEEIGEEEELPEPMENLEETEEEAEIEASGTEDADLEETS